MKHSQNSLIPSPYQLVALTKLVANGFGGLLIADGVGVGKTISAGYVVKWMNGQSDKPVVICVPPGLVDKWSLELRLRFGITAHAIRSAQEAATARSELERGVKRPVYLLTYPQLRRGVSIESACLIIDEIHNFRNETSLGFKQLRDLAERAEYRVGLSATPVNNGIGDLANIFSILLSTYDPLAVRATVESIWAKRQFAVLSPVMTRFTKENLAIHFVRREVEDKQISLPEDYSRRVREAVGKITGRTPNKDAYPMEAITYFREAASSSNAFSKSVGKDLILRPDPKVESLRDLLRSLKRKAIVFCQFAETVRHLARSLTEFEIFEMTGETPISDRPDVVSSFAESDDGVLLLTSVGTEGLDFQFCDAVVNYDLHWNPMVLEQRLGRIDRRGQTKAIVYAYNFRVAGSIDERISTVLRKKIEKITGTPLANAPISDGTAGVALYDDLAFRQEEKEAKAAVEAQALSSQLQVDDHLAVACIPASACDPGTVPTFERLEWLENSHMREQFESSLRERREELGRALGRYQEVV